MTVDAFDQLLLLLPLLLSLTNERLTAKGGAQLYELNFHFDCAVIIISSSSNVVVLSSVVLRLLAVDGTSEGG